MTLPDKRDIQDLTRAIKDNTKALDALRQTALMIDRSHLEREANAKPNLCTAFNNCPPGSHSPTCPHYQA